MAVVLLLPLVALPTRAAGEHLLIDDESDDPFRISLSAAPVEQEDFVNHWGGVTPLVTIEQGTFIIVEATELAPQGITYTLNFRAGLELSSMNWNYPDPAPSLVVTETAATFCPLWVVDGWHIEGNRAVMQMNTLVNMWEIQAFWYVRRTGQWGGSVSGQRQIAFAVIESEAGGQGEEQNIETTPTLPPTIQLPPRAADGTANVTINGELVAFPGGIGPDTLTGRTLVPVRGVFEALGFEVEWLEDTRTVTLDSADFALVIQLDNPTFYVNGTAHTLDVPAQNVGGRTMLPIRLPLEAVGFSVGWDDDTRTVLIYN
jgi:hypothetical protein